MAEATAALARQGTLRFPALTRRRRRGFGLGQQSRTLALLPFQTPMGFVDRGFSNCFDLIEGSIANCLITLGEAVAGED